LIEFAAVVNALTDVFGVLCDNNNPVEGVTNPAYNLIDMLDDGSASPGGMTPTRRTPTGGRISGAATRTLPR
jgi:hypothetical protein